MKTKEAAETVMEVAAKVHALLKAADNWTGEIKESGSSSRRGNILIQLFKKPWELLLVITFT